MIMCLKGSYLMAVILRMSTDVIYHNTTAYVSHLSISGAIPDNRFLKDGHYRPTISPQDGIKRIVRLFERGSGVASDQDYYFLTSVIGSGTSCAMCAGMSDTYAG